jgi:hypothetical protein
MYIFITESPPLLFVSLKLELLDLYLLYRDVFLPTYPLDFSVNFFYILSFYWLCFANILLLTLNVCIVYDLIVVAFIFRSI